MKTFSVSKTESTTQQQENIGINGAESRRKTKNRGSKKTYLRV